MGKKPTIPIIVQYPDDIPDTPCTYTARVRVGCLPGWHDCKVIDISNLDPEEWEALRLAVRREFIRRAIHRDTKFLDRLMMSRDPLELMRRRIRKLEKEMDEEDARRAAQEE